MLNINLNLIDQQKNTFNNLSIFCDILHLPNQNIYLIDSPFYYSNFIHYNINMQAIYFEDKLLAIISEKPINHHYIFFKDQNSAVFIKQFIISHLGHIQYNYPTFKPI